MLTPNKIKRLKRERLKEIATQKNLTFPDNIKRPELIKMLIDTLNVPGAVPIADSPKPGNRQDFLNMCNVDDIPEAKDNRGGDRPGAGRKPGVTLQQSRLDNLPKTPNRAVMYWGKWGFAILAKMMGCPELELSGDELESWALDTTEFMEYHGIKIPQGAHVDTKFIATNLELIGSRVFMVKMHRANLKQQKEKENKKNAGSEKPKTDNIRQNGFGQNSAGPAISV